MREIARAGKGAEGEAYSFLAVSLMHGSELKADV